MTIVFITNNFPPVVDGVGDYTFRLCKIFSKEQHEVSVVCSACHVPIKDRSTSDIQVIRLRHAWSLKGIKETVGIVKKIRADWVMIQYVPFNFHRYGFTFNIFLLCLLLKMNGIKVEITFHEFARGYERYSVKHNLMSVCQRISAYLIAATSDKIVVSTHAVKKQLKLFQKKVTRIPIGSNLDDVSDGIPRQIINEKDPDLPSVIATFGSSPRSNILLIDVIAHLREKGFRVKLLFIGRLQDEFINMLKERAKQLDIENLLSFTGYLPAAEAMNTLCTSDVFVLLPTIDHKGRGGIGTKSGSIAAAFAAGLPIVSIDGHLTDHDIFVHDFNILLAKQNDVDEISRKVAQILSDEKLAEKLKKNALFTYHNHLSWKKIYKQYHLLLSESYVA